MLKKQIGIKEMSFLWRQEIKVGNFYPKTFGLLQTQKNVIFLPLRRCCVPLAAKSAIKKPSKRTEVVSSVTRCWIKK